MRKLALLLTLCLLLSLFAACATQADGTAPSSTTSTTASTTSTAFSATSTTPSSTASSTTTTDSTSSTAPSTKTDSTSSSTSVKNFTTTSVQSTIPSQTSTSSRENFTGQWLDKATAEKRSNISRYLVITKIYANCFFAEFLFPSLVEIKVNGVLSDEWCVGDHVACTYKNIYHDADRRRVEADLVSIATNDREPARTNAKPVIYLYPEKEMSVSVNLTLDGRLTCTYPAYNNGWTVTAAPDGTLTDEKGQTYNYLYWEGETFAQYDLSKGFCIKGEDTAAFLEEALEKLGLTRREANEFIVYWLPLMEQNPYNVIAFQTDIYTESAQLAVNPAPDTLIRVFMAWQASDTFVELPTQVLSAPDRVGFTVVEWGGTEMK